MKFKIFARNICWKIPEKKTRCRGILLLSSFPVPPGKISAGMLL